MLLAQVMIVNIRKRGQFTNMVIKIDMAKVNDRVDWNFLIKVWEKMGFNNMVIDTVWIIDANSCNSVFLNGQARGFFHSTIRVKRRDSLSSALFILVTYVLSRTMNKLFDHRDFKGYGIPKWSDNINQLAYADDFDIVDRASLQLIMMPMILMLLIEIMRCNLVRRLIDRKVPF